MKRNILLNPGPATTTDSVKQALVVPDICPREQEFGDLTQAVLKKVVAVVNGESTHSTVIFAGSGTAGVEAALSSVVPKDGKILLLDNGAYGKRAETIIQAYGISHRTYRIGWGEFPDITEIETILKQDRELTHFAFVHHETTTGMLNPLPELLELCQKYEVDSIVDAMSSYAGLPIDLRELPIDFLISSSNKCIQGMAGTSFVIANREKLAKTETIPARNLYLNLWGNHSYIEKTGQFQFTPPVQIVYALNTALDEFFVETQAGRTARYFKAYETLLEGLEEVGLELLLPKSQHSKLLTAIVEPQSANYNFMEMHDYFYQNDITIYPGKGAKQDTFRIANIGEIDYRDMQLFNQKLLQYFEENNISPV
ncbi:MAG: 2-aminoethylphosphonate--pyruvate transaminase [SAR324 cluster bacterium]|nr:2-aminoethylphosphonate--pyruvate transaminase [SAR324 cluster bacterium]MBL7034351.1 2-aminoethylphosphonate--pyruvate transaminase [SAR324 cluster bacterium]